MGYLIFTRFLKKKNKGLIFKRKTEGPKKYSFRGGKKDKARIPNYMAKLLAIVEHPLIIRKKKTTNKPKQLYSHSF